MAAIWLAMLAWRFSFTGDWRDYYYRFDAHATGLIAGIILCFALRQLPLRRSHAYLASALLILLAFTADITRAMWFIPFAEIAAALVVACLVTGNGGLIAYPLRSRIATTIGRWSYAIYLWHFPFAYWARSHWGFAATALSTIVFATAMAAISHATVEAWGRRRSRALRDKRTAIERNAQSDRSPPSPRPV